MFQFGLTRNKDSIILRPKTDKRNKGPPQIRAPLQISAALPTKKIK